MAHPRTVAALGVLLLGLLLASVGLAAPLPQSSDEAGVFTTGPGIANDALRGWARVQFQGGVRSRYYELLIAPLCSASNVPGCLTTEAASGRQVGLSVERVDSQASPPGDELPAYLEGLGYVHDQIVVDGQLAQRFSSDNPAFPDWQIVVLEFSGVYYHLSFSQGFRSAPEAVDQLLAGFDLQPEQAPPPYRPGDEQPAPETEPTSPPTPTTDPVTTQLDKYVYLPTIFGHQRLSNAAENIEQAAVATPPDTLTQTSGFNLENFVKLARFYGPLRTNPGDGCYLSSTTPDGPRYSCVWDSSIFKVGLDGAHFIDCMLKEAGFPGALCSISTFNGTIYGRGYLSMNDLYNFLAPRSALVTGATAPGDILFLYYQNRYCWGGIVVETTSSNTYVATHSQEGSLAEAGALYCYDKDKPGDDKRVLPDRIEYLRLDGEAPFARFLAPEPGLIFPGPQTLVYEAEDPAGTGVSSGVASYTLRYSTDGATITLAADVTQTSYEADLDLPCRALDLSVLARDQANNADEARAGHLNMFVLLRGDTNADGTIGENDYRAISEADGLAVGQPGYALALDPTGDGRVDAADRLFVEERLGDTCPRP